jgi:hypothetical protein
MQMGTAILPTIMFRKMAQPVMGLPKMVHGEI